MNNVERIRRTGLILIGVGLLWALFARGLQPTLSAPARNAGASDAGTSELRVVEASRERLLLELQLSEYAFEAVTTPEGVCHQLVVPGHDNAGSPGHPSLPVVGAVAGVPLTGEPTVRVLDAASQVLPSTYVLCPRPQPALDDDPAQEDVPGIVNWTMTFDPDAYEADAFLPAAPAEIGEVAFIRDQRVATVRVHPFQYNPATGEIRVYTRLRVELAFNTTAPAGMSSASATPPATTNVWERSLRSLLVNYDEARNWRGADAKAPTVAPMESLGLVQDMPRYRIETKESGLYALSFEDIQAAEPNVDLSGTDSDLLRMTSQGSEIAIDVDDGDDGTFDADDVIYFYAEALETRYADANVFWLSIEAEGGARMSRAEQAPLSVRSVPTYFVTTEIFERDHIYRAQRISADGDNWYWDQVTGVPPIVRAYPFELANPAAAPATATLTTRLLGYGTTRHSITVLLNGHDIYTDTWAAGTERVFTVTVPSSHLLSGTNTVSITVHAGSLYVNRFRLTYGNKYMATDDALFFDGDRAGSWEFQVGGFTTDTVRFLDITDPRTPLQLDGIPTPNGDTYTFAITQTIPSERRYYAVAPTQIHSPTSIVRDATSNLHSDEQGADYIIITHADFTDAAQKLAVHRAGQGLRTVVVDVQDVYDEFNFGIPDPEAVRTFLSYAYHNWRPPAPTYVVLFGDGHYDPKGNLDIDAPPSYMLPYLANIYQSRLIKTAADNRYVAVAGDDSFPDMHIGRLPVNSQAEAAALVTKIISYEEKPIGEWSHEVSFIADDADGAGDFSQHLNLVADSHLPAPYQAEKIYLEFSDEDTEEEEQQTKILAAQTAIREAINQGRLIVNYAGHGAVQFWAAERLLTIETARELTNTGKLPFMVPMTCWEGYYIEPAPEESALAETLVRLPDRGAIASWSATGLAYATGHDYLNRALFDAIFQKDMIELGPATTYAKLYLYTKSSSNHDLIDTYLLFGDPATRLNVLKTVYLPSVAR
ncbi:MAG: C25 family cysteine peptidase [Anaerolineae bacterium]